MILNLVAALGLSGGVYLPNPLNEEITEEDQFCVSSPVPYYGFPLVTTKMFPVLDREAEQLKSHL